MYCNQCGAQVPDDAKFCQICGRAVGAELRSTAAEDPRPEDTAVPAKKKRPKRNRSLRLKKLLTVLGGAAALVLAAVLIVSAVREHKRTTILGEIPDPEIFFGVSGTHYRYESSSRYAHNIEFETENVTKDMINAYVDLLNSSEFPFVMDDSINDVFSSGMRWYLFRYNGSQELYDAAPNQIKVEYDPDYEQIFVTIFNSKNFELVPVEPYNAENTFDESAEPADTTEPESEPQSEPETKPESSDPSVLPDFLAHDDSGEYQLLDESTPNKAIYQAETIDSAYVAVAYVELLEERGYTVVSKDVITYSTDNDKTFEWFLSHSSVDADDVVGDAPGQVRVRLNVYEDNSVISVTFSEGITMENYNTEESSSTDSTGGGYVDCPNCYGGNCTACNGRKGEYSYSPGLDREWEECWKCNGTGKCSRCGGHGQIFG